MNRWLPHPVFTIVLLLAWLLLQPAPGPASVLFGLVLALLLSRLLSRLKLPPVRVRHARRLVLLLARVLADLVRSNLAVARIIINPRSRYHSGFVRIPLALTQPHALAMLSCIITATPGTIWVSHDSDRRVLVIHVLDLRDESAWRRHIKQRYEQPLMEIFQ